MCGTKGRYLKMKKRISKDKAAQKKKTLETYCIRNVHQRILIRNETIHGKIPDRYYYRLIFK